jgi:hypothetical protein
MSIQTDNQRLASIDLATQVGRSSDSVVIATIHWERNHELLPEDIPNLDGVAGWLESLASAIADPLDLEASLPQLGTLDVLNKYGQLGSGIKALLPPDDANSKPLQEADSGSGRSEPDHSVGLVEVAQLLRRFANLQVVEEEVFLVRGIFERLAQAMLSSAADLLTTRSETQWTQNSDS